MSQKRRQQRKPPKNKGWKWLYVNDCMDMIVWTWLYGNDCMEMIVWTWLYGNDCMEMIVWTWLYGDDCMEMITWKWLYGHECMEIIIWTWLYPCKEAVYQSIFSLLADFVLSVELNNTICTPCIGLNNTIFTVCRAKQHKWHRGLS